jgi:hypothetical protein
MVDTNEKIIEALKKKIELLEEQNTILKTIGSQKNISIKENTAENIRLWNIILKVQKFGLLKRIFNFKESINKLNDERN